MLKILSYDKAKILIDKGNSYILENMNNNIIYVFPLNKKVKEDFRNIDISKEDFFFDDILSF